MSDLSKDISKHTAANHAALRKHPLPVAHASYSHVHVNTMERTNRGGPRARCPSASWSWALERPAALVGPRLFICGWSCLCCGQSERQTLALLRWCVNTPRIFLGESARQLRRLVKQQGNLARGTEWTGHVSGDLKGWSRPISHEDTSKSSDIQLSPRWLFFQDIHVTYNKFSSFDVARINFNYKTIEAVLNQLITAAYMALISATKVIAVATNFPIWTPK